MKTKKPVTSFLDSKKNPERNRETPPACTRATQNTSQATMTTPKSIEEKNSVTTNQSTSMEFKRTSYAIGSAGITARHASPADPAKHTPKEAAQAEQEQKHQLTSPTFRPNLDEAFSHHVHHVDKDKVDTELGAKSVSERLYDDAKHRMEQQQKKKTTNKQSSPKQKKKNTATSMSSPFQPDLSEAFSHHHIHSERGKDTNKPVSDRQYEDAVHRKQEIAAGHVDAHCQHELDRERLKAGSGGGDEDDHVHLKSPREHPMATDLCPKADYLRRMGSSMSVDGGSIEDGIYPDSSFSSYAGEDDLIERCECGNIIQLDLDLDAAVHPSPATVGDGNRKTFSPDIRETQKVVASPRNAHIHAKKADEKDGEISNTAFERLYQDKEQRERRLTMEKIRIKKEDEKELTFHPQTNLKHDKDKEKRKSARKQSIDEVKARKRQNCLGASVVKQTQDMAVGEESAAELLEKDLRLVEDENESDEINGSLLEPGETLSALAASQPQ